MTDAQSNPVQHIAVIGSGYMGGGIAQVLALSGAKVRIADVSAEIAAKHLDRLIEESKRYVADGLFPEGATETIEANLAAAQTIEQAVLDAQFIEEAVPERPEAKLDVLARIGAAARPDAIIGSNTSTIAIGTLAEAVEHPERFLGVHFSNPAPFIPGVELIPHAGTDVSLLPTVEAIVAATGKSTARVKDKTGFVLNRLQFALFTEAARVVEEGVASAEDVDTIVRTTFGFRLPFFGPFAIADMAGLDTYGMSLASVHAAYPDRFETPAILQEHLDRGEFGTKSGAGFLNVPTERTPELVAYRDRAYVAMQQLLDDLGPAPL